MSEHVDVSKIKDPTIAAARMKVKMHRILTVVKNILIVKSLNSQHLLAVNQGFYL